MLEKLKNIYEEFAYKLDDLYYKLSNKYIMKYNKLHIQSLQDDTYYDDDSILLHANFQVLVNFVESNYYRDWERKQNWFERNVPFPFNHFFENKSKKIEYGIKHLQWSASLPLEDVLDADGNILEWGNKSQALSAKEALDLYDWWVNIRPNRKEPEELSGWNDWYDYEKETYGHPWNRHTKLESGAIRLTNKEEYMSEEDVKKHKQVLKLTCEIEEAQHQEDEDMLIRLIKIRRTLWT